MIPCWPPQKWASETDWHVSCDVSIMRRWPHELLHGEAGGDGVRFRTSVVRPRTTRAIFSVKGEWRPEPESNRRARICSPLRNHSAIGPKGPAFPEAHPRGQALGSLYGNSRGSFDQWRLARNGGVDMTGLKIRCITVIQQQ